MSNRNIKLRYHLQKTIYDRKDLILTKGFIKSITEVKQFVTLFRTSCFIIYTGYCMSGSLHIKNI